MTTLQQARQDLQAGRIDAARQKALAAQKLDASFELWDDRPETLLDEIDQVSLAQKSVPSKKAVPNDMKARATSLLKAARADLAAGRVSDAWQKATRASEMDVAFGVFEDRPETVLAAIQHANSNIATRSKTSAPDATKRSPAKNAVQPTSASADELPGFDFEDSQPDPATDRVILVPPAPERIDSLSVPPVPDEDDDDDGDMFDELSDK